jgi:hypothetical protein
MKRSDVIKLIVPIISANGPGDSVGTANLILKQLDELRILNPKHKVTVTRRDVELMPYEEKIEVPGWDKE